MYSAMSVFESFCENSKMRLVSQKKGFWVGSIVQIREGFYRGLQGFCISVLGFAMRAGSASQSSACAEWATTAGDSSERDNQGTAGFSFVKWQLLKLEIGCFIFQYHPGAAFRGSFTDEFDEVQDDLEAVGRNINVRQVPRKALQRCVMMAEWRALL